MRAVPDESRSEETIMSLRESKFLADLFLSVIEDEVKKNVKIFKAIPEARRSAPHRGSVHKRPRPQLQPRVIEGLFPTR